ncbi:hypothetical protein [Clostridium sp. D53t1_180928_C8]|uniref:hypothetical protein n=1 Tax=Clostridium sp. D53t1_180928_C8 TaxID=2787101 RepID=UPI0018A98D21|nr:hypothetical protein [Clostridium sp. D53t1_180928_C8]
MLLTENPKLNLKVNGLDITFKFDFNTIQNLYYGLKDEVICKRLKIEPITPLQLLEKVDKEFENGYFILLIHSSMNGNISLDEIIESIKHLDINMKKDILYIMQAVMIQSLVYVDKFQERKDNSDDKKEEKLDAYDVFEDWFNYFYVMAIDKLKISFDDFLKSTAAQIKERVNRINIDFKNNFGIYNTNIADNKENSIEEVSDIRDFFNMI